MSPSATSSKSPRTILTFSILVEAVVAAGLAPTLSTGMLTVFAPTNAAFAALLSELGVTKEALLADKPLLTAVLTYHVLGSRVPRADVPLGKAITPVSGGFFKIESANGLKITDGRNRVSTITATDIQASNGVVHLVDRVLLPANKDIVATALAPGGATSFTIETYVEADPDTTVTNVARVDGDDDTDGDNNTDDAAVVVDSQDDLVPYIPDTLPRTGSDIAGLVATGVLLVLAGFGLRRYSRRKEALAGRRLP